MSMISQFIIPYPVSTSYMYLCDFQFENFRINFSIIQGLLSIWIVFQKKRFWPIRLCSYLLMPYWPVLSAAILATCARKYKWWPWAHSLSVRWAKSIQKCPINLAQRTYRRASHVHKLIENQPTPLWLSRVLNWADGERAACHVSHKVCDQINSFGTFFVLVLKTKIPKWKSLWFKFARKILHFWLVYLQFTAHPSHKFETWD